MATNFFDPSDLCVTTSNWEQYENMRLERLKEQRQRMEIMKDVLSEYTETIRNLELNNELLQTENYELKKALNQPNYYVEHNSISQKYSQLSIELEKERKVRENCEEIIESLKQELTSIGIYEQNILSHAPIDSDYEVLQKLYEDLKDEVYVLHKENLSLKEVIRDQSRFCYEKEGFWKENEKLNDMRTASTNGFKSSDGKTKEGQASKRTYYENYKSASELKETLKFSLSDNDNASSSNISKSNPPKRNSISDKSESKSSQENIYNPEDAKHKIKSLKEEIRETCFYFRKLNQLIDKFRLNEEQQLNLIEILKKKESKVCLCHSHGKSSKKLLNSENEMKVVSFKKDEHRS